MVGRYAVVSAFPNTHPKVDYLINYRDKRSQGRKYWPKTTKTMFNTESKRNVFFI